MKIFSTWFQTPERIVAAEAVSNRDPLWTKCFLMVETVGVRVSLTQPSLCALMQKQTALFKRATHKHAQQKLWRPGTSRLWPLPPLRPQAVDSNYTTSDMFEPHICKQPPIVVIWRLPSAMLLSVWGKNANHGVFNFQLSRNRQCSITQTLRGVAGGGREWNGHRSANWNGHAP